MRNKPFLIIMLVLVVGFASLLVYKKASTPQQAQLGTLRPDQGQKHIQQGESHEAYNSDLPSSGPHYANNTAPAQWGIYTSELTPEVYLHNQEHGGVVIAYSPTLLNEEQIKQLQNLFAPPYETKDFQPRKFILMPREKNTKPIQLAAWRYTLDLDTYDEDKIKTFFSQRAGKAPESMAGPSNTPINQVTNP